MRKLSDTRDKIFNILLKNSNERLPPPSIRELMNFTGIKSPNTIRYHLKHLESEGLIDLQKKKARSIKILKSNKIPLLGKVAAGKPLYTDIGKSGHISLIENFFAFQDKELYALKVAGDSMKDIHIVDGDYAIIREQPEVENGEIAAVLINGEGTLKRVRKKGKAVKLYAENSDYPPISLRSSDDIKIFGKMVGLIRSNI